MNNIQYFTCDLKPSFVLFYFGYKYLFKEKRLKIENKKEEKKNKRFILRICT